MSYEEMLADDSSDSSRLHYIEYPARIRMDEPCGLYVKSIGALCEIHWELPHNKNSAMLFPIEHTDKWIAALEALIDVKLIAEEV